VPTPGASDVTEFLRVSEVHYHPADPSTKERAAGFINSDEFEFIELVNTGDRAIDLSAAQFETTTVDGNEEGVAFDFANASVLSLGPGARTVVVENLAAFKFRYGDNRSVAGQWNGRLNNAGETISLAAFGQPFLQFRYDDEWYPITDGDGPSLEFIDVNNADLSTWNRSGSWRASRQNGGTPGLPSSSPGDANHDGVFDSRDLVQVFQAAEYEDSLPGNSTWEEGDWNGDGDFGTSDLVLAFQTGGYIAAAIPMDLRFQSPLILSDQTKSHRRPRRVELIDATFAIFEEDTKDVLGQPGEFLGR
jgi:hypothetical protein